MPSAVDEETLIANLSTAQKKIEHLTEVTAQTTFGNISYPQQVYLSVASDILESSEAMMMMTVHLYCTKRAPCTACLWRRVRGI